jgi:hypothetical protein
MDSWRMAKHKHPFDGKWNDVPANRPFYYSGGSRGFGHIVVTAGNGWAYGTDIPRSGQVGLHRLSAPTVLWGHPPLGYTDDINGKVIAHTPPSPPKPKIDLSAVTHAVKHGGSVANGVRLKKAVAAEVGPGKMNMASPALGRRFRNRYRKLQHKWYGTGDGVPGPISLTRLCKAHGLDPRP